MPLTPGTKLGQYEVVESVGSGGMGEVYRARDTKLGRDVAIKVLPEEFAQDRERLDRFEREARLLAQLNHANIATLHGLEEPHLDLNSDFKGRIKISYYEAGHMMYIHKPSHAEFKEEIAEFIQSAIQH